MEQAPDIVSKLERLASLLEKGLLTNDEFNQQKSLILGAHQYRVPPPLPVVPPPLHASPFVRYSDLPPYRPSPSPRRRRRVFIWIVAISFLWILSVVARGNRHPERDLQQGFTPPKTYDISNASPISAPVAPENPEYTPGVSAENFERLKSGMKYDEVFKIFGVEGVLVTSNRIPGKRDYNYPNYKALYQWIGPNCYVVSVQFDQNLLSSKREELVPADIYDPPGEPASRKTRELLIAALKVNREKPSADNVDYLYEISSGVAKDFALSPQELLEQMISCPPAKQTSCHNAAILAAQELTGVIPVSTEQTTATESKPRNEVRETKIHKPSLSTVTIDPDYSDGGPLQKTINDWDEHLLRTDEPILRIPAGTELNIIEQNFREGDRSGTRFFKVTYKGKTGWINEHFTTASILYRRKTGDLTPEEKKQEEGNAKATSLIREFGERIGPIDEATKVTLFQANKASGDGKIWTVTVEVHQLFHVMPYQHRLQLAQGLQDLWASVACPTDPDSARLSLVDARGNEVGGSRFLAGSLIWVQKE